MGLRQLRGIVLVTGALIAVAAVSSGYLRPPAAPVTGPPRTTVAVSTSVATQPFAPILIQHTNLTGSADDGYYFWHLPGGGSGGHAP